MTSADPAADPAPDHPAPAARNAAPRYAIYFAPDEKTDFFRIGSHWLGYDVASRRTLPPPLPDGMTENEWRAATDDPRKYGLHGTLKAPFRLAPGRTEAGLIAKLSVFANGRQPVDLGTPNLSELGSFLAITPGGNLDGLASLAADCVTLFDEFRDRPTESELARRRAAGLTPAQDALLQRWGYPYVLDEFRFHVTLTGRLDETARKKFKACLERTFSPVLSAPLRIESVCLFVQPAPDARFHLHKRFPLGLGGA